MLKSFQLLLLRAFIGFLSCLPKSWISGLSKLLYFFLSPLMGKEFKKLYLNVEKIYGVPKHSGFARNFAKQVILHQIESGIESLISCRAPQGKDPVQINGLSELEETIAELKKGGRGIVVVTGHLGMWEFVAKYCAVAAKETFNALAKPSKSPAVTQYMDETRGKMNTNVLWTDKKTLLKDMISVIRKGEILGFVMDQKPDSRKGPEVEFFDRPTVFVSGPAKLAAKMNSPVLGVFCMREGPWQYRIVHKVILEAEHDVSDELHLTQEMASEIERVIKLYPEQWVWNYKRWRFQ